MNVLGEDGVPLDPLEFKVLPVVLRNATSGVGLAASQLLNVLVLVNSGTSTVDVYKLPYNSCACSSLEFLYAVHGDEQAVPCLKFCFAGFMAWVSFTDPNPTLPPLLLVTDGARNAVRVYDLTQKRHYGFVGACGSIAHPRAVASKGYLCAVCENEGVSLFSGCGASWSLQRKLGHTTTFNYGVRFAVNGASLVFANYLGIVTSHYQTEDDAFTCQATPLYPVDVEEHKDGRWLVLCCGAEEVLFSIGSDSVTKPVLLTGDHAADLKYATAMAFVPNVGLVVRAHHCLKLLVTPAVFAMDRMSVLRVAWMSAVVACIMAL